MSSIRVHVDGDLAALLHATDMPIDQAARELMVLELYRRGMISSGKAAEMLAMERFDFVRHASRLGIAVLDMTADEWAVERAQADQV